MEQNPVNLDSTNLTGMSAAAAKDYILGFITTLKLTEKEIQAMEDEAVKWKGRVELACSRGAEDLIREAKEEAERVNTKLAVLWEEVRTLRERIDTMRRQLAEPSVRGLAARERSIDPDLLEQELLMALGRTEEEAETERAFRKLETESSADAALEALKAKMKGDAS